MILLSIGLPGDAAARCDAIAARLVETALGPTELFAADTVEAIGAALVRLQGRHAVIAARRPDAALRAVLAAGGARVLAIEDEPHAAVRDLLAQGLGLAAATRAVATSCAALVEAAALPGAAVLPAAEILARPASLAAALGIDRGAAPPAPPPEPAAPWRDRLDPAARALVDGAVAAYAGTLRGGLLGEIVWDRGLLWRAGDPAQPASAAIELAGGARELVAGPDIALPAGRWAATLTLAVSREAAGIAFAAELVAGAERRPLAAATVVPDGRGIGSATLPFAVDAATPQPLALRLATAGPAAAGRLALGNVTLVPGHGDAGALPVEFGSLGL